MDHAEDRDAIADLLARYCAHLDRDEHEEWVELFAAEGEFLVYGRAFRGHDGLLGMASAAPAGLHLASPAVIDVDGDTATARQGFLFIDRVTRDQRIGYYDDVLVRSEGRWRLRTRRSTFLTPSGPSERP